MIGLNQHVNLSKHPTVKLSNNMPHQVQHHNFQHNSQLTTTTTNSRPQCHQLYQNQSPDQCHLYEVQTNSSPHQMQQVITPATTYLPSNSYHYNGVPVVVMVPTKGKGKQGNVTQQTSVPVRIQKGSCGVPPAQPGPGQGLPPPQTQASSQQQQSHLAPTLHTSTVSPLILPSPVQFAGLKGQHIGSNTNSLAPPTPINYIVVPQQPGSGVGGPGTRQNVIQQPNNSTIQYANDNYHQLYQYSTTPTNVTYQQLQHHEQQLQVTNVPHIVQYSTNGSSSQTGLESCHILNQPNPDQNIVPSIQSHTTVVSDSQKQKITNSKHQNNQQQVVSQNKQTASASDNQHIGDSATQNKVPRSRFSPVANTSQHIDRNIITKTDPKVCAPNVTNPGRSAPMPPVPSPNCEPVVIVNPQQHQYYYHASPAIEHQNQQQTWAHYDQKTQQWYQYQQYQQQQQYRTVTEPYQWAIQSIPQNTDSVAYVTSYPPPPPGVAYQMEVYDSVDAAAEATQSQCSQQQQQYVYYHHWVQQPGGSGSQNLQPVEYNHCNIDSSLTSAQSYVESHASGATQPCRYTHVQQNPQYVLQQQDKTIQSESHSVSRSRNSYPDQESDVGPPPPPPPAPAMPPMISDSGCTLVNQKIVSPPPPPPSGSPPSSVSKNSVYSLCDTEMDVDLSVNNNSLEVIEDLDRETDECQCHFTAYQNDNCPIKKLTIPIQTGFSRNSTKTVSGAATTSKSTTTPSNLDSTNDQQCQVHTVNDSDSEPIESIYGDVPGLDLNKKIYPSFFLLRFKVSVDSLNAKHPVSGFGVKCTNNLPKPANGSENVQGHHQNSQNLNGLNVHDHIPPGQNLKSKKHHYHKKHGANIQGHNKKSRSGAAFNQNLNGGPGLTPGPTPRGVQNTPRGGSISVQNTPRGAGGGGSSHFTPRGDQYQGTPRGEIHTIQTQRRLGPGQQYVISSNSDIVVGKGQGKGGQVHQHLNYLAFASLNRQKNPVYPSIAEELPNDLFVENSSMILNNLNLDRHNNVQKNHHHRTRNGNEPQGLTKCHSSNDLDPSLSHSHYDVNCYGKGIGPIYKGGGKGKDRGKNGPSPNDINCQYYLYQNQGKGLESRGHYSKFTDTGNGRNGNNAVTKSEIYKIEREADVSSMNAGSFP